MKFSFKGCLLDIQNIFNKYRIQKTLPIIPDKIKDLQEHFANFWRHHPALLYGIALLIGASFALYPLSLPLIIGMTILISLPFKKEFLRSLLALALAICGFFLTEARYQFPSSLPVSGGSADVDIETVTESSMPFGKLWTYSGTLISYTHEGKTIAKGIPVKISLPQENYPIRPTSGMRYRLQGTLKETLHGAYVLKPDKRGPWEPIASIFSFSEWRYTGKRSLLEYLNQSFKDKHVKEFLAGIAIGEFNDRSLSTELGRFGLQHITAISGLHFSILCSLLGFTFYLFLPRNIAVSLLITFMTLYFVFLGNSPSVTRAWISITITLAAFLLGRGCSPLNSLGVALIIIILANPLTINELGFQFSFGVTLAILLWYKPCEEMLKKPFPKRPLKEAITMSTIDQHGYCFLYFLRQAIALGFAVNLVAFPLTLFHFHKFPLMGLLYNLFFPPLVSICLLLLLLAFAAEAFISPLAEQLHSINEYYTQTLLNLGFYLPRSVDAIAITVNEVSYDFLIAYLIVIVTVGIVVQHNEKTI